MAPTAGGPGGISATAGSRRNVPAKPVGSLSGARQCVGLDGGLLALQIRRGADVVKPAKGPYCWCFSPGTNVRSLIDPHGLPGMNILVVDDHVLIREALRGVLKELRHD